jgi:hypothetical protein
MKHISLFYLLIFSLICTAQKDNDSNKLSEEHYLILKNFITQKYNHEKTIYINKNVVQKKYSSNFKIKYNKLLNIYKNADSICNSSLDTLSMRINCKKAYFNEKYVGLLEYTDLDFFEKTSNRNLKEIQVIDTKKLIDISPKITNHTENFYDEEHENLNFKETPSLKIHGFYFSENKNLVLIAYMMFPLSLRNGLEYGILKKEKGFWWRLIGSVGIDKTIISHQ